MRPAVSAETITESAPDCLSRWRFSNSRTEAVISALGASSRTESVTSTAVSSVFGATTTERASPTPAIFKTSARVPEPRTATSPAERARSKAAGSVSMTTIRSGDTPSASSAATAERPFVP